MFFITGIDPLNIGFLHLGLLHGLRQNSPFISLEEMNEIKANQQAVIWQGRKKGLNIRFNGRNDSLEALFALAVWRKNGSAIHIPTHDA